MLILQTDAWFNRVEVTNILWICPFRHHHGSKKDDDLACETTLDGWTAPFQSGQRDWSHSGSSLKYLENFEVIKTAAGCKTKRCPPWVGSYWVCNFGSLHEKTSLSSWNIYTQGQQMAKKKLPAKVWKYCCQKKTHGFPTTYRKILCVNGCSIINPMTGTWDIPHFGNT